MKIVERFDAAEKAWGTIAPSLEGRSSACSVAVNQKVFVFGGLADGATEGNFCEVYDPAIDVWSTIASTVVARADFISAVSLKGKVYVCGCFGPDGSTDMSLQEYDTEHNEWKFLSIVPTKHTFSIQLNHTGREISYAGFLCCHGALAMDGRIFESYQEGAHFLLFPDQWPDLLD
ncbi:hypothetical protein ACROYT_G032555 [Oculina patagonica]